MNSLRARTIRLAHANPTLRPHLLPLLSGKTAMEHATEEALKKYLSEHPKANPKNHKVKPETGSKGPVKKDPVKKDPVKKDPGGAQGGGKGEKTIEDYDDLRSAHGSIQDMTYADPDKVSRGAVDEVVSELKKHGTISRALNKILDNKDWKKLSDLSGNSQAVLLDELDGHASDFTSELANKLDI